MPKSFLDYLSPPPYKFHPEDPLGANSVPLGRLIAEFPIMMSDLLNNMKSKLMVGVEFVLLVPIELSHAGGNYTIYVLR